MRSNLILSFAISLLISSNVSAQFTLEDAFPNLSFNDPLDLQNSGDGTNRIFVAERAGIIKVFPNSSSAASLKTYIDITDRVSAGGEMGLLGLAFHPDYENNGYFYVNYTVSNPLKTRISRFQVSSENPDSADKNTELILLTFNQPYSNHNGGWIGFGPDDGYLYIGTGDGGSGGDPQNNGQSIITFLGKILRIDIDNQDPGLEYAIPDSNPFVDSTGSVVKEIYAWGMRNPWRNSFDAVTGWLWSADVGQNQWEEVDIIENGKNYGWRCYEGTHSYNTSGCNYPEYIDPVWEYSHSLGCSVTGGYVYRGPTVPELTGKYIYADYCDRTIWSLEYDGIPPPDNQTLLTAHGSVTSFGVDENNELYVVTFNPDRIYRFSPSTTGFEDLHIPFEYKLEQNFPNPFNPNTNIKYQVGNDGFVSLVVFNYLGEVIANLVDEFKQAGIYQISFNGANLPSGVYVSILKSGNFIQSKKMILLK
jgi:glucose/arabinose dehydrogenase